MGKTKSTKICPFDGCGELRYKSLTSQGGFSKFCRFHVTKATIDVFLKNLYRSMKRRVNGQATKRPDLYTGLPILPREVFIEWSKNHPDFLKLYKRWLSSEFDRKLTPTVNRMNSSKGYLLNNIEWMTNSQNCGLSNEVRSAKQKKAIYELLGIKR